MIEQNVRLCKKCLIKKPRISAGKYPDGRNSRWVDCSGREWSGRSCPDCHVVTAKVVMRKMRTLSE